MAHTRNKQEMERQREEFCRVFAMTGSLAEAAKHCGYKNMVERHRYPPELVERAQKAREEWCHKNQERHEEQQSALKDAADVAILTLRGIAEGPKVDEKPEDYAKRSRNAVARVNASVAILDRAGHKPVERIETDVTHKVIDEQVSKEKMAAIYREALQTIEAAPTKH